MEWSKLYRFSCSSSWCFSIDSVNTNVICYRFSRSIHSTSRVINPIFSFFIFIMCYVSIHVDYFRAIKEYEQIVRDKKLMLKGLKYGYYAFAILFILAILLCGNYVLAYFPHSSAISYNYTFNSTSVYNGSANSTLYSNANNNTIWTDIYNATDSFTGLPSGSTPSSLVITDNGGTLATIEDYLHHNSVMKAVDSDGSSHGCAFEFGLGNSITEYGSIEFWTSFSSITQSYGMGLYINSSGVPRASVRVYGSKFQRYDGSWVDISGAPTPKVNQWYHFRYDWENTAGRYKDLLLGKWQVWIDGVKYGTYQIVSGGGSTIQKFGWSTSWSAIMDYYVDAIGNSCNNSYILDTNLFPYNYTTNDITPSEYRFNNDVNGQILSFPEYTIPYWNKEGISTYTEISNSIFDYGGMVIMSNLVPDLSGIYKDFSISDTSHIALNYSFRSYSSLGGSDAYFSTEIYDDSSNLITCINLTQSATNDLKYYDGSAYQTLATLSLDTDYRVELFMYSNNIAILSIDGSFYRFYTINSIDSLGIIRFRVHQDSDTSPFSSIEVGLDKIGVYVDSGSLSTDFSGSQIDLNVSEWNNVQDNLFSIDIIGNCSISVSNTGGKGCNIFPFDNYNGTYFINLYMFIFDISPPSIPEELYLSYTILNPYLVIISNSSFSIGNIHIYGLKLSDGINDYLPYYEWNNIDGNNSYFYGSNEKMYWTFTCNNSNYENITATFDIPNVETTYYLCGTTSFYKNTFQANAELRLVYIDSSYSTISATTIPLSHYNTLPSKILDKIKIVIYDTDYNTSLNGYIQDFSLIYRPDLDTPITTVGFMDILPFLIMIVFIPVVFMLKWKMKLPILTPAMFLMTIFSVANNIIPLWLGFVICLSLVMYWIINRRIRG